MSEIINRLDFSLLRFLEAALHSPLPACSCSSKHNIYPCVETTPKNHLLKWFMYDRAISHLEKKPFIFVSQVVILNFWLCPWPWYSVLLFMSLLTGSSHLELVASTVYLRLHHPSPWLSLSFCYWFWWSVSMIYSLSHQGSVGVIFDSLPFFQGRPIESSLGRRALVTILHTALLSSRACSALVHLCPFARSVLPKWQVWG